MRPEELRVLPATPGRWRDVETLFGERGACGGCWCMVWRIGRREWEQGKGTGNRAAFRKLVEAGRRPGILAYHGRVPVAWCAVAPREDYPALGRSRVLAPIDERPVWSVSCLFVLKAYRRRGVSVRMLREAVAFAARRGARVVEGYPVESRTDRAPDAFVWTGTPSAFLRAGFEEALRRSSTRPIMRIEVPRRNATA